MNFYSFKVSALAVTSFFVVFHRKDLCEGKHDARVRNFVSNYGVLRRERIKQMPFYLK